MKHLILVLFFLMIALSVLLKIPVIFAILCTIALYFIYGFISHEPMMLLFHKSLDGIRYSLIVVVTIACIGVMGALWRSSGLISYVVMKGLIFNYPPLFLLYSFLLTALFSFIMGSSFATASIIGVILMTIGLAGKVNPALMGGIILSGAYFGDRASFLSSSAFLVSKLSKIDHKTHVRNMLKEVPIPLIITSFLYIVLSRLFPFMPADESTISDLQNAFRYDNLLILLPLLIVLLPVFTRLNFLKAILLSLVVATLTSHFIQGYAWREILHFMLFGYSREGAGETLRLLFGAGLFSMNDSMLIVGSASALPPLLKHFAVLESTSAWFSRLAGHSSRFFSAILSSLFVCSVACSQTLAVFLHEPIVDELYPDGEKKALVLADTSILFPALIPWNVACFIPLRMINAPMTAVFFAFFIVIVPGYVLVREAYSTPRK